MQFSMIQCAPGGGSVDDQPSPPRNSQLRTWHDGKLPTWMDAPRIVAKNRQFAKYAGAFDTSTSTPYTGTTSSRSVACNSSPSSTKRPLIANNGRPAFAAFGPSSMTG